MERLQLWLEDEPVGFRKTAVVVFFNTFFMLIYAAIIVNVVCGSLLNPMVDPDNLLVFWLLLFPAAFWEELIFRTLPLGVAVFIFGFAPLRRFKLPAVMILVVMASIIFGYLHGGWIFVALQGAGGIMLSLCYLKCGGYNSRFCKATAASSASHFLYNTFVLMLSV